MYHTKPPEENGWYWVRFDDGAVAMVGWNPEDGESEVWHLSGIEPVPVMTCRVEAWIGPLHCPFGDMASDGAYFAEDQYQEAIQDGKSLVMTLVDGAGDSQSFGTVMSVYQMSLDDALSKISGIRRTVDLGEK